MYDNVDCYDPSCVYCQHAGLKVEDKVVLGDYLGTLMFSVRNRVSGIGVVTSHYDSVVRWLPQSSALSAFTSGAGVGSHNPEPRG